MINELKGSVHYLPYCRAALEDLLTHRLILLSFGNRRELQSNLKQTTHPNRDNFAINPPPPTISKTSKTPFVISSS